MTTFNFTYFLSIFITLSVIYLLHKKANNYPEIVIYFIIPITVSYLTLLVLNLFFNSIDDVTNNLYDYSQHQYYEMIKNTGYFNIFPPFLIFILVFIILLYYQKL